MPVSLTLPVVAAPATEETRRLVRTLCGIAGSFAGYSGTEEESGVQVGLAWIQAHNALFTQEVVAAATSCACAEENPSQCLLHDDHDYAAVALTAMLRRLGAPVDDGGATFTGGDRTVHVPVALGTLRVAVALLGDGQEEGGPAFAAVKSTVVSAGWALVALPVHHVVHAPREVAEEVWELVRPGGPVAALLT